MTPASPPSAVSGVGLLCAAAFALLACTAGCSSDGRATDTTTGTAADTTVAGTAVPDAHVFGSGAIAGETFTATAQFVQFDQLANTWRLHILTGEHGCADDLAAARPSVGIDFLQPTETPPTIPPPGTTTDGIGVVFRPTDPDAGFGPLTTTTGVTLTLDGTDPEVGHRWSGHLTVTDFQQDGAAYGFDGPIDAEVCPAVDG